MARPAVVKGKSAPIGVTVPSDLRDFYDNVLRWELRRDRTDLFRDALTSFAVAHGYEESADEETTESK